MSSSYSSRNNDQGGDKPKRFPRSRRRRKRKNANRDQKSDGNTTRPRTSNAYQYSRDKSSYRDKDPEREYPPLGYTRRRYGKPRGEGTNKYKKESSPVKAWSRPSRISNISTPPAQKEPVVLVTILEKAQLGFNELENLPKFQNVHADVCF